MRGNQTLFKTDVAPSHCDWHWFLFDTPTSGIFYHNPIQGEPKIGSTHPSCTKACHPTSDGETLKVPITCLKWLALKEHNDHPNTWGLSSFGIQG